jgi:hypothetical protein
MRPHNRAVNLHILHIRLDCKMLHHSSAQNVYIRCSISHILWAATATARRCVSPKSLPPRSADISVLILPSPVDISVKRLGFSSIVRHLAFGLS